MHFGKQRVVLAGWLAVVAITGWTKLKEILITDSLETLEEAIEALQGYTRRATSCSLKTIVLR